MKDNSTIAVIVIAVVLFFLLSGSMMWFPFMGGMGYGYYNGGMNVFGWIFMSLVLIALVLLIAWLIKQIQKK